MPNTFTKDGRKFPSFQKYDEDEGSRRDDIKTIKARVKTLEAALRDIAKRTEARQGTTLFLVEFDQIHRIAVEALGESL